MSEPSFHELEIIRKFFSEAVFFFWSSLRKDFDFLKKKVFAPDYNLKPNQNDTLLQFQVEALFFVQKIWLKFSIVQCSFYY